MSAAGVHPTFSKRVLDATGTERDIEVAGERPLTIYLDRQEIVTLMTLGSYPEALALGYLRNQGFIERIEDVVAIQVDWDVDAAAVTTHNANTVDDNRQHQLGRRVVTSGCGQGTMFGHLMDHISGVNLNPRVIYQSEVYALLKKIRDYNDVYKKAGAVHGCAFCDDDGIKWFVEDVGRHNAVDAIAGMMWLGAVSGDNGVFYTTGRLTSEMVIKVAQIGVSVLLSRSGVTEMGCELAEQLGITMIARAKGRQFFIVSGRDRVILDDPQPQRQSVKLSEHNEPQR